MHLAHLWPSGGVEISDIVKGQYIHRVYLGYTITEAKRLFRQYRNEMKKIL